MGRAFCIKVLAAALDHVAGSDGSVPAGQVVVAGEAGREAGRGRGVGQRTGADPRTPTTCAMLRHQHIRGLKADGQQPRAWPVSARVLSDGCVVEAHAADSRRSLEGGGLSCPPQSMFSLALTIR